jgi:hypothetical protein
MGLRTKRERAIVGRHYQLFTRCLSPEQRAGKVNCVRRSQFGRHRLRRAIEDDSVDLDEFERGDYVQDCSPP